MAKKSLAETHPEVAKQWHPTKNGDLTPNDFTGGSQKKVWWKCDKGEDHEWLTSINKRSAGSECTICSGNKVVKSNCLATTNPKLAKQWHPTKNGDLKPEDFSSKSHFKVWWLCPNTCKEGCKHEWESIISSRTKGNGCSYCSINKLKVRKAIKGSYLNELSQEDIKYCNKEMLNLNKYFNYKI